MLLNGCEVHIIVGGLICTAFVWLEHTMVMTMANVCCIVMFSQLTAINDIPVGALGTIDKGFDVIKR